MFGKDSVANLSPKAALYFVLLFGVVSLFADMTYEGARSVTGPFLATLGASGLIVGSIAGLGELLGYTLRLVSGRWADHSKLYWPITLAGYLVQMAAVPALALAGSWQLAAAFIVLERIGKATRNPPRDVMLAQAGTHMGRGWAFGINEALDQFGAFVGPLVVAVVLAKHGSYQSAFAMLAIPAIVTLILVFSARSAFPNAGQVERRSAPQSTAAYHPAFWWYLAAAALVGFGFADFSLVAYHFSKAQIISPSLVPIFYALAMAAGGIGALIFGKLFDRIGLIVLVPVTLIVAAYAPLVFLGGSTLALAGSLLWGVGLGAHESVMQAAVAHLVPHEKLGSAYGLFGAAFGIAWFAGSVVLGAAYDASPAIAALVAAIAQVLALAPLAVAIRGFNAD